MHSKLTRWPLASLIQRMAQKRKNKEKRKPSSSEEAVQAIVRQGNPGGRSKTTGVTFVKQVGFKPGVKERELRMSRMVNQMRKE